MASLSLITLPWLLELDAIDVFVRVFRSEFPDTVRGAPSREECSEGVRYGVLRLATGEEAAVL